ncbi:MAG TPA: C2 family cysteine protease [Candidatus Dormibacteraeota bacterium]
MGNDSSSAYPERLKTYGQAGQRNDSDFVAAGRKLSMALAALSGSHPDPAVLPGFEDWGQDLVAYGQRKVQIDAWVESVGRAFEKAGGVTDPRGDPLVTVSTSQLDGILAAQDPAVQKALAYAHLLLPGPFGLDPEQFNGMLRAMTPEQLQELFWAMGSDDLRKLGLVFGNRSILSSDHGLRDAFENVVLASVDPETLARLMASMPMLQPDLQTKYLGHDYKGFQWSWQGTSGPLFGPDGVNPLTDINQGDDGDCWFLAGMGAIALANPSLIQQNIRPNANGTYTVTFYQDGRPVPITVTGDLPYGAKGNASVTPYAHPGPDGASWAAIYEKAYAELRGGGYGQIDGGFGDTSLANLSGRPATRGNPSDYSLSDIQSRLHQGYAITAGSNADDNPWWDFWDHPERMDNNQVVTSHEYYVKSVDMNGHPPTITVVNPWGAGGGAPQLVTLTEQQWHHYFGEVSLARVGPG